jgi:hypothetical protein
MGFRSLIEAQVDTAFRLISGPDNLADQVTYQSSLGAVYDPDQGTNVESVSTVVLPRVVFYDFEEKQVNDTVIMLTDKQCIFPAKDLGVIKPKGTDMLLDTHGQTWQVIKASRRAR